MGRYGPSVLPIATPSPWEAVRESVRRGIDRHQAETERERQWAMQDRQETRSDAYLALQQTINARAESQRQLENERYTRESAIRDAASGLVPHNDAADHSRLTHVEGVGDIDPTRSTQYIGAEIERDRVRGEQGRIAGLLQRARPGMSIEEATVRTEAPQAADVFDRGYQPRTFEEWKRERAMLHADRMAEIQAQYRNRSTANTALDKMIDDTRSDLSRLRLRLPRVRTSRTEAEYDGVMAQIRAGEARLRQLESERDDEYGYTFQPAPVDAPPAREPQKGETGMRPATAADPRANAPPSLSASSNRTLRPLTAAEKDAASRDPGFRAWLQRKGYVF